jgi:hypothetical protein
VNNLLPSSMQNKLVFEHCLLMSVHPAGDGNQEEFRVELSPMKATLKSPCRSIRQTASAKFFGSTHSIRCAAGSCCLASLPVGSSGRWGRPRRPALGAPAAVRNAVLDGEIECGSVCAGLTTRLHFREQCHEVTRHGCDIIAICKHRSTVEEFALDKSS